MSDHAVAVPISNRTNKTKIKKLINGSTSFLIILVTAAIILFMTRLGAGISPDSSAYINAAQNLAMGNGMRLSYGFPPGQWINQFPPVYPLVLSVFEGVGASATVSARWLNLSLLLVFLFLLKRLISIIIPDQWPIQTGLVAFAGFSITTISIFTMVWSETIMLVFGFLGLLILNSSLDNGKLLFYLAAGFLFSVTALTRFAGIPFLFAAVSLILIQKEKMRKKFRSIVVTAIPAIILFPLWIMINIQNSGVATSRSFAFHPPGINELKQAINTTASWVLVSGPIPIWVKGLIVLPGLIVLIWVAIYLVSRIKKSYQIAAGSSLVVYQLFFIFWYLIFVGFSLTFLDANIPLDTRILSPIFFSVILVFAFFLARIMQKKQSSGLITLLVTMILLILASLSVFQNRSYVSAAHQNGIGFNRLYWQQNPAWEILDPLREGFVIVSTTPEPIALYTRHDVYSLPRQIFDMDEKINPDFLDEIQKMKTDHLQSGALFVFFPPVQDYADLNEDEVMEYFNLKAYYLQSDVHIYQYIPADL